jgi:hypothetical protein
MKWALFILLLFSTQASTAQAKPTAAVFTGGIEADVLPFITGGYYMSVWGGYKHVRYRVVLTDVHMPSFMTPNEFANHQIDAYALIADYFFHEGFTGWWIGSGLEWWKGEIDTHDASATGSYTAYMYTIGAGYVRNFFKGFYLNPWAGIHLKIGGDQTAQVGALEYTPPVFTPEISLKLGWRF